MTTFIYMLTVKCTVCRQLAKTKHVYCGDASYEDTEDQSCTPVWFFFLAINVQLTTFLRSVLQKELAHSTYTQMRSLLSSTLLSF